LSSTGNGFSHLCVIDNIFQIERYAPPGYYLIHVLNNSSIPSAGKIIQIGQSARPHQERLETGPPVLRFRPLVFCRYISSFQIDLCGSSGSILKREKNMAMTTANAKIMKLTVLNSGTVVFEKD